MKYPLLLLSFAINLAVNAQQIVSVHFDLDKYELDPAAKAELDQFINANQDNTAVLKIWLNGYCDPRGSDGYNDRLSLQRVNTVKKYLLDHGIPSAAIVAANGHGERDPLNENKTAEEMALNRRVQLSYTVTTEITTTTPATTPSKTEKPVSLKQQIADTSITAGKNIVLRNINFVGGRHQFLEESTPMLEELLAVMQNNPGLIIRVEGHICCQEGNADAVDNETGIYNLSTARAKAVRDYLVYSNIPEHRVSYMGFGHSAPLYPFPEKTEAEKTANRRVEIRIIQK